MTIATLDTATPIATTDRLLRPGELRRSELISGLSTALDMTEGQPEGHSARSTIIAMAIGRQIALPDDQLAALYYGVLLKDLGCSSNAAKMAYLFGADDRIVKRDVKTIDWVKMSARAKFALRHVAPNGTTLEKAMRMAAIAREGEAGAKSLIQMRCQRGATIATQLGFTQPTAECIEALDEHWDGQGHPYGKQGTEIPLLGRIAGLAQTIEVFHKNFDQSAAIEVAIERSGRWFDPELVDAFLAVAAKPTFWTTLQQLDWQSAVEADAPHESAEFVDEEELDNVCQGFASVVDAKSSWTATHSQRVAEISVGIAHELDYSAEMKRDIRRAALLHDLGKLGVSNTILDKPGKPTDEEFAQIKLHPEYSEQILRRIPLFDTLTDIAVAHHEKLDGTGYHKRLHGSQMPLEARIIAVADIYEALTADRPYREGLPAEKVESIMSSMLGHGIDHECYNALLQWRDKTTISSRVEVQLEAIEQLHNELA